MESTEDFNALMRKRPNVHDVGLRGLPNHDNPLCNFLSYALNPAHGGSPVVDLMAVALQRFGVECLIFPSARHDCGVEHENDRLAASIGWNLVDYRGFTSDYSPRHLFVLQNVHSWQKSRGLLRMGAGETPYAVNSWVMLGLSDETQRTCRELMWRNRLADRPNINLGQPVLAERTPWSGRGAAPRPRVPRLIRTWRDLQIALIIEESELDGMIRDIHGVGGTSIGSYMARLSAEFDAWGFGKMKTVYETGAWCLVQPGPHHGCRLICPACGDAQEESIYNQAFLLYCRSCFAGRPKLSNVGEEAVIYAVNCAIDSLD